MFPNAQSVRSEGKAANPRGNIMAWLTTNWIWALIFVAFVAMHLFGHGGHGGHGGKGAKRSQGDIDNGDTHRKREGGGHQH